MRLRGHEVTIATSSIYKERVESEGLGFHPVRPEISLDDREKIAQVMDPRRGSELLIRFLSAMVRESYEDFLVAGQAADVIVTHPATPGAVLAAKKLGGESRSRCWISSVLAPLSLMSAYDPPVFSAAPWLHGVLRAAGPRVTRAVFGLIKRQPLAWAAQIVDFARELGMESIGNPFIEGQHSPNLVLALFSRLIASPQPDWPPNTVLTGFPLLEDGNLSAAVERFVSAGSPPVVFTLGTSAVGAARDFYVDSLRAVERLGVRAVFLTGSHPQGLPDNLPASTLAIPYVPHAALFPRASAVVHQGGIGTTAQAMRAGRPELVVPFAHDQFDNAERVRRLGLAEVVPHAKYSSKRAEMVLARLLSKPNYGIAAKSIAERVRAENGAVHAADAIEASF